MQKNRIYLRKKGDDKNRKKKDFFPPEKHFKELAVTCMTSTLVAKLLNQCTVDRESSN